MKTLLKLIFVLTVSIQIQAQERLVSGIITEESGLPVTGVNVLIKGTSSGVTSNFDGYYEIRAKDSDTLVFSFIGYKTLEIKVDKKNDISISLEAETEALDEVVVIGYGITKTRALTGSVTTVSAESISGKVSGISIRGVSSVKSEHVHTEPQSGQLTAGEINDLEKWQDWLQALKEKEHKLIQENWGFYLENRIEVSILDEIGNPVNNVKVSLFNDLNELIMSAKTDVYGKVYLFKDFNKVCEDEFYVVQVVSNNKVQGKKITNTHQSLNFVMNNSTSTNDIDVMFTIDATGSMSDEINYLKSEIKNIISRLDEKIETKRVGLTFYRDYGDEYVVRDFDFNDNIENVKENLSSQTAGGGGDYEEAVEQALKVSLSKTWNKNAKTRLMFLLLDAPPHLNQENVSTIKNQIKVAQDKGVKIIPIVASGADKTVEFLMRFFSLSTNGTYVFLTDDSGIGNPHLKPTTTDYKVEKLNDLIVRLIEKYSGIV